MKEFKWNKKTLFLCVGLTIILGILIHGYMLTNKFYNHDDLDKVVGDMNVYETGRWFLFGPAYLESNFLSNPWYSGILGFLYLGLAIFLLTQIFELENPVFITLIGFVFLSFPSLSGTLLYGRFFSPYMFALLLMFVATFAVLKLHPLYCLLALPMMVLSLGIYQAYLAFYVGVAGLYFLKELLQKKIDIAFLWRALRVLLVLFLGIVIYTVITKQVVANVGETLGYQGVENLGQFDFTSLGENFEKAYGDFYSYFIAEESLLLPNYIRIGLIVLALTFLGGLIWKVFHLSRWSALLAGLLLFLMPLGISVYYFMGIRDVHHLIKYSLTLYLIAPILLFFENVKNCKYVRTLLGLSILVLLLLNFSNTKLANSAYMHLQLAQKQNDAYAERLITRIESTPAYDYYDEVAFIGESSLSFEINSLFDKSNHRELLISEIGVSNMHSFAKYLKYYQGFHNVIHRLDSVGSIDTIPRLQSIEMEEVIETFLALPAYPADGSILRLPEGVILVKFSDEY